MHSPTKATPATAYERPIEYGFEKGPDRNERVLGGLDGRAADDPRLAAIAEGHSCEWPPAWLHGGLPRIRLHFPRGP